MAEIKEEMPEVMAGAAVVSGSPSATNITPTVTSNTATSSTVINNIEIATSSAASNDQNHSKFDRQTLLAVFQFLKENNLKVYIFFVVFSTSYALSAKATAALHKSSVEV